MTMKRILAIFLMATIPSASQAARTHSVEPHYTRSGKFVPGHMQTNPDHTKIDNWSTSGNVNPFTGRRGHKKL